MKLKDEEFVVDSADPFKNDALGRKSIAINLAQFLTSLDVPFVLSINSRWGTGKTTFVKMLQQYLKNIKVPTLYFNAWESDFADPLIGFISEIQEQIVKDLGNKDAKAKERFDKAKKIGLSVAKHALPAAVKAATAGLINLDEMTEEILSGIAEGLAKASLEEFQAAKKSISEFRTQLEQFAKAIEDDAPIIIFVDELDRCRPPYAIALLERIKHLFSVSGIVFVLVLDRSELANVISAHYGLQDTLGYLTRFIDLEYRLPEPSIEQFVQMLFSQLEVNSYFTDRHDGRREGDSLLYSVVTISTMFGCSLRSIERCLTQIVVIMRTTPKTEILYPSFIALLVILKIASSDEYDAFVRCATSGQDLVAHLKTLPGGSEYLSSHDSLFVEAFLVTAFIDDEKGLQDIKLAYEAKVGDESTPQREKNRAARIAKFLEDFYWEGRQHFIKALIAKIELTKEFVSPSQS